ncbi:hypothetical protein DW916_11010 [Segatella copri]|uniref:Uncharacterized protein n=3 Tax=Segatella copri TaxID=165179 RepID=A0AA92UYW0_9BACT|nr:hypothetical protein DW916_11010 [Segatella copri]
MHILIFIIIFATKIMTNFRIMVGILIFSAIAAFITLGVGHTLNRMGKHVSSYPHKGMEDEPKLTIEDMYSPNNNLSLFFKDGNSYSVLVSNHSIDKEEFVFADNTINLRNKVARVLRNYAALEKSQNKDSVIL